jgi:hypothetical protein
MMMIYVQGSFFKVCGILRQSIQLYIHPSNHLYERY